MLYGLLAHDQRRLLSVFAGYIAVKRIENPIRKYFYISSRLLVIVAIMCVNSQAFSQDNSYYLLDHSPVDSSFFSAVKATQLPLQGISNTPQLLLMPPLWLSSSWLVSPLTFSVAGSVASALTPQPSSLASLGAGLGTGFTTQLRKKWQLGLGLAFVTYGYLRLRKLTELSDGVFVSASDRQSEDRMLRSQSYQDISSFHHLPPDHKDVPPFLFADREWLSEMDPLEYMHAMEDVSEETALDSLGFSDQDDLEGHERVLDTEGPDEDLENFPTFVYTYLFDLSILLVNLSEEIAQLEVELNRHANFASSHGGTFAHELTNTLGGRGVMTMLEWQSWKIDFPVLTKAKPVNIIEDVYDQSHISMEAIGFKLLKLASNAAYFLREVRKGDIVVSPQLFGVVSRLYELYQEAGEQLVHIKDRLSVHRQQLGEYALYRLNIDMNKHLVSTHGQMVFSSLGHVIRRFAGYFLQLSGHLDGVSLAMPQSYALSYMYSHPEKRLDLALVLAQRQLIFGRDKLIENAFFSMDMDTSARQKYLSEEVSEHYQSVFLQLASDLDHDSLKSISDTIKKETSLKVRFGSPFALRLLQAYAHLSKIIASRGIGEDRKRTLMRDWDNASSLSRVEYIQRGVPSKVHSQDHRRKWLLANRLLEAAVYTGYHAAKENIRLISLPPYRAKNIKNVSSVDKRQAFLSFDQANYELEQLGLEKEYERFSKEKAAMEYFLAYLYKIKLQNAKKSVIKPHINPREHLFNAHAHLSILVNIYPSIIIMQQAAQVLQFM
ncbi:MAG: hypothetical protein OXC44_06300 [Proteobacteria bacterium]|nr:hypothetical protein [Pseudomonadota bacterium]